MNSLDVVEIGAKDLTGLLFDDVLIRLGYQGRIITPADWVKQIACFPHKPTVLVIGQITNEQREGILSALRSRHHKTPLFGVFRCDSGMRNNKLLDYFDDFIFLPCQEREFSLRLKCLLSNGNIKPSETGKNNLLEPFLAFNLIGHSPAFIHAIKQIKKVTCCDAPVLITGETGTGKESCARAIHYLGKRCEFAFIPINCGSIPDNLLENELFGHVRGAYTDAKHSHPGVVEQAEGGTLFLDEIDSLSDKAQVALLRFTQNQEYRPLGCCSTKQADVRIVAATNADLAERVASGCFREDLLYRLNVLPIWIPPLRERNGDIALIAQHILKCYSSRYQKPLKRLHPETLAWMEGYSWPGNVRELENLLQRGLLLSDDPFIRFDGPVESRKCRRRTVGDRRVAVFRRKQFSEAKALAIENFEKSYLQWLIAESNGNVSEAARLAGKERRALGKLLKKYNIDRAKFA